MTRHGSRRRSHSVTPAPPVGAPQALTLLLSLFPLFLSSAAEVAGGNQTSVDPLGDPGAALLRLLGALAFVVGVFLAGAFLFRKWQSTSRSNRPGPRLNILDVQSLGARQAVYVIGCDHQRFLVGATPQGLTLLAQLPDGPPGEGSLSGNLDFGSVLSQAANSLQSPQRKAP